MTGMRTGPPATERDTVDTVVFDIGGVLVQWDPRHLYRRLLDDEQEIERFLATVCTPAWHAELDRGRPFAEAVGELAAQHPEHAALIHAYHERWDEMLPGPVEGTATVLDELRDRGVPCYGLTNFSLEKFLEARTRFPVLQRFDGVLVSGAEGLIKPDPAIYRLLCERFAVEPSRTVFIDDSPANTEAARGLGFTAVDFRSAEGLRRELVGLGLLGA